MEPGYSSRIDTPEFKEAMGKANRTYLITTILTALLLPPAVTAIAWLVTRAELPILIGACIIVWVITFAIVGWMLAKRFLSKSWDGLLTAKRIGSERAGSRRSRRSVYIMTFMTDDGRKKRFKERTIHPIYDYLEIDDRVRYHPQLSYPFEKFDKSGDEQVLCPFCGRLQPIDLDECASCHKPLLK